MVRETIQNILDKELARKKHEYIKLQWQKARLEQLLREAKQQESEYSIGD